MFIELIVPLYRVSWEKPKEKMNRGTIKESTYKALSPTPQWINTVSSSACFKFLITTGSAETEVDISEPGSRLILCQILVSV